MAETPRCEPPNEVEACEGDTVTKHISPVSQTNASGVGAGLEVLNEKLVVNHARQVSQGDGEPW